jgi:hypothetical protein
MVTSWIQSRSADIRRDLRRRLRREIGYYVPIITTLALWPLIATGTMLAVLNAAVMALLLGGMMATLWSSERRLASVPLDRSSREVLSDLIAGVDRASWTYLVSYVALFVCAAAIGAAAIAWHHGMGTRFLVVLGVGMAAIVWSYWSGHAYVRRMFGSYRSALDQCLRDLNGAT